MDLLKFHCKLFLIFFLNFISFIFNNLWNTLKFNPYFYMIFFFFLFPSQKLDFPNLKQPAFFARLFFLNCQAIFLYFFSTQSAFNLLDSSNFLPSQNCSTWNFFSFLFFCSAFFFSLYFSKGVFSFFLSLFFSFLFFLSKHLSFLLSQILWIFSNLAKIFVFQKM